MSDTQESTTSGAFPRTTYLRVDGGRIAYDEAGHGPAVLFSHAGMADRRMWESQFRALSANWRVIRYDWRGVGESDTAVGPVCHYQDLLAVLDALAVDDAVLVGCSMGGAYALDAALAAPTRVRGLVLISSGLSGHVWPAEMRRYTGQAVRAAVPAERLALYQARAADEARAEDVDAMAQAQARLLVAGPNRKPADVEPATWQLALTMLRDLFTREWSAPAVAERQLEPPAVNRLAEVRTPTVVVNGAEDLPWLQQVSDLLGAGIPGAQRVDLAGTAHLAPVERPDEVTRAIQRIL
ncbi:alpha/beta fold hydrolase [Planosporangium sp. 12N6]|uniref:alpha/beta fold hydrolase n=1 Tax=Planosporangium spinosum TaxID=3402278 RepID=UPI003CF06F6D